MEKDPAFIEVLRKISSLSELPLVTSRLEWMQSSAGGEYHFSGVAEV